MRGRYQTPVGSWTHRTTFFWATTGATVGLSDIWTFPAMAGDNGGGVFILVYLFCLLGLIVPLMLTESVIGRGARHGVVLSIDALRREAGAPTRWVWSGRLSVLAGFLVLSFYAVIGGICLAYVFYAAYGQLTDAAPAALASNLSSLVQQADGYRAFMGWHAAFLVMVLVVSGQGVVNGLERAMRVVLPLFMVLLLALLYYSAVFGNLPAAVDFLLRMRPEDVTLDGVRMALTHAFYTLSLGTGILIVFGAYSAPTTPIKRSVFAVALVDTLIAMLAGLVIYALVFSGTASLPGAVQGFSLVFLSLPESLSMLPGGQFVATAFFVLIVLVAWSSSLALLEPAVSWLQERLAAPRGWSVLLVGVAAWLVGLLSLFSFNIWSEASILGGTAYRWIELLTSTVLIPVVSLLLAFFVGWALPEVVTDRLIGRAPRLFKGLWLWTIRLVLPVIILYVGIHYAMQSGSSLCSGNHKLFWCAPAAGPDAMPAEGAGEPASPARSDTPSLEPTSEPEVLPDASGEGEAGLRPLEQAAPSGAGQEAAPSSDDLLYHSV
ncbi:sodium-dependent transporter [Marinobacter bohaiensis]|uniref:sodium-dependent transporter n=1 Tax=Marinobacter bohaiensis TaxID=2201898 RepID=UPI000DAEA298|nr:sodium-dependent transporter [Marinobacter bohaiensis]